MPQNYTMYIAPFIILPEELRFAHRHPKVKLFRNYVTCLALQ